MIDEKAEITYERPTYGDVRKVRYTRGDAWSLAFWTAVTVGRESRLYGIDKETGCRVYAKASLYDPQKVMEELLNFLTAVADTNLSHCDKLASDVSKIREMPNEPWEKKAMAIYNIADDFCKKNKENMKSEHSVWVL